MSHSIYLLETKFPVLLRTATQLLPLVARQKSGEVRFEVCGSEPRCSCTS
ncbi:hypothetical protein [Pilibacter termitis]|nr:hypothetical protein [Pilibacter termitis]